MKKIYQLIIAGSFCLLTGCGTDYRIHSAINTDQPFANTWSENLPYRSARRMTDPEAKLTFINPYTYNPSLIGSDQYIQQKRDATLYTPRFFRKYPTDYLPVKLTNGQASYYQMALVDTNHESSRHYRNELQSAMFRVVKESTAIHLSELKATENGGNLLLGAATIGLSGGASVASGAAAHALAAAATGTAGARGLFNEQLYRQTFVESITSLIEKDQERYATTLIAKQTNFVADYSVEAAITDVKEYEDRGSFYHGLTLLQSAVQRENQYTNISTNGH